eukprot:jgi/Mesen1/9724/ME000695S09043
MEASAPASFYSSWPPDPGRKLSAESNKLWFSIGSARAQDLLELTELPAGEDANLLLLGCGDIRHVLQTAAADKPPPSLDQGSSYLLGCPGEERGGEGRRGEGEGRQRDALRAQRGLGPLPPEMWPALAPLALGGDDAEVGHLIEDLSWPVFSDAAGGVDQPHQQAYQREIQRWYHAGLSGQPLATTAAAATPGKAAKGGSGGWGRLAANVTLMDEAAKEWPVHYASCPFYAYLPLPARLHPQRGSHPLARQGRAHGAASCDANNFLHSEGGGEGPEQRDPEEEEGEWEKAGEDEEEEEEEAEESEKEKEEESEEEGGEELEGTSSPGAGGATAGGGSRFDVIETSTQADFVGLLNLLLCCRPLLKHDAAVVRVAWPVVVRSARLQVSRRRGSIAFTLPKSAAWPPLGARRLPVASLKPWPRGPAAAARLDAGSGGGGGGSRAAGESEFEDKDHVMTVLVRGVRESPAGFPLLEVVYLDRQRRVRLLEEGRVPGGAAGALAFFRQPSTWQQKNSAQPQWAASFVPLIYAEDESTSMGPGPPRLPTLGVPPPQWPLGRDLDEPPAGTAPSAAERPRAVVGQDRATGGQDRVAGGQKRAATAVAAAAAGRVKNGSSARKGKAAAGKAAAGWAASAAPGRTGGFRRGVGVCRGRRCSEACGHDKRRQPGGHGGRRSECGRGLCAGRAGGGRERGQRAAQGLRHVRCR